MLTTLIAQTPDPKLDLLNICAAFFQRLFELLHFLVDTAIQINHFAAFRTNQVWMRSRVCIKTVCASRSLDANNHSHLFEQIQVSIDRSQADLRQFLSDSLIHFLRIWMLMRGAYSLIYQRPLFGISSDCCHLSLPYQ